jgi:regulator of replication initiation timing
VEGEDLHRGVGGGMVHNEEELTLENEKLKEENKRLKHETSCIKLTTNESLIEENKKLMLEKEHLKVGLSKFAKGKSLQSDLLMNIVMKMDRSGIGY